MKDFDHHPQDDVPITKHDNILVPVIWFLLIVVDIVALYWLYKMLYRIIN